ncbi:hypothetical protein BsWGS_22208 [Bradybaena similaris]
MDTDMAGDNITVECPVCGRFFDSAVISEHANSCLNISSTTNDRPSRKRKSSDWNFLTGYSKTGGQFPAQSAKTLKSMPSKGKSKVGISNTKLDMMGKEKTGEGDGVDSSSDVEFVDQQESDAPSKAETVTQVKDVKIVNNSVSITKANISERDETTTKHPNTTRNLFTQMMGSKKCPASNVPLAERARPLSLDHFVGQEQAVGRRCILHSLITYSSNIPSMVLWGPPGCGKTTLAKIIAQKCKEQGNIKFITMSATSASVNDVKEVAKVARKDIKMFHKKTILFLDEIHRFNKTQQDVLLPHVEDGTITLIGATTENPSFHVNGALLSRCRVITLEKLQIDDIKAIIKRALPLLDVGLHHEAADSREDDVEATCAEMVNGRSPTVSIESEAVDALAGLVDGDARAALNGLQMAVEGMLAQAPAGAGVVTVTVDVIKEALQRSHVLYDKTGEEHYNLISALIKSLRGSDASAALYWMTRILEGGENPLFIARRLVIFASEDVGLADPVALTQAVATHQACQVIGMPECPLNLAQCVVYLARAPKSNEVYRALQAAKSCVKNHQGALPSVPLHLRNAPTKLMQSLGYGKDYKYPHDYGGAVEQDYFPACLIGTNFFSTS